MLYGSALQDSRVIEWQPAPRHNARLIFLRLSPISDTAATAALDSEHRNAPNRDVVPLA
jgi:hypothetical protein